MPQGNVVLDLQRSTFLTSLSIQSAKLAEGPVEGAILSRYFYSQLDATPLGVTHRLAISKHPCYSDVGTHVQSSRAYTVERTASQKLPSDLHLCAVCMHADAHTLTQKK